MPMRIRWLPLGIFCALLCGCPGPDNARPPNGRASSRTQYPDEDFSSWPEAVQRLRASGNPAALASNRFDSMRQAIGFVRSFYDAGALRVAICADTIMADPLTLRDEGGPDADTIVIKLPAKPPERARVIELCQPEFAHEGTDEAESRWEDSVCLSWACTFRNSPDGSPGPPHPWAIFPFICSAP